MMFNELNYRHVVVALNKFLMNQNYLSGSEMINRVTIILIIYTERAMKIYDS